MKTPFGEATRRRVHLLRHGEAAYRLNATEGAGGTADPPLTPRGRAEAEAQRALLHGIELDFALCTTLQRTRETCEIALGDRQLEIHVEPDLSEITATGMQGFSAEALADGFKGGEDPKKRFAGGEVLAEFQARVVSGFERTLRERAFAQALFVCHGGTNRAIVAWALGCGAEILHGFEQDSCCLNVVDVDVDAEGNVVRKIVRALNVTPADLAKRERWHTTLEETAIAVAGRS